MRPLRSLFLSGPDLWFPDGDAVMARKAALCEAAGFAPVDGRAGDLTENEPSEVMAREIYASVLERLRGADAVIANLTPWRGAHADPGSAFEVGFAAALGKPVFAYMNVADEDEADVLGRVGAQLGAAMDAEGRWSDAEGCAVEDFGLPENLMLWAEARHFVVIVTTDPFADLTGMEHCLAAVRDYAS